MVNTELVVSLLKKNVQLNKQIINNELRQNEFKAKDTPRHAIWIFQNVLLAGAP